MAKSKSTSKHQVIREPLAAQGGEIVLYQAPDGSVKLDVRLEKDTIWLSLNQMAALFDRDKSVIQGTCAMCSGKASWTGSQLLHFLQQFKTAASCTEAMGAVSSPRRSLLH